MGWYGTVILKLGREEGPFSKNKTPIPKFQYTALGKHASPLKIKAGIEVNVLCNK